MLGIVTRWNALIGDGTSIKAEAEASEDQQDILLNYGNYWN
jgi:hypothetical protein